MKKSKIAAYSEKIGWFALAIAIPVLLWWASAPAPQHYDAFIPDSELFNFGDDISHVLLDVNGIKLHAIRSGPSGSTALGSIVFVHGFPEYSGMWEKQLRYFGRLGYNCIAFDMRGYFASEKPAGFAPYSIAEVVKDVAAVLRTYTVGRRVLVGHDWGGIIAFATAQLHPDLMEGLCVLNAPHKDAMQMLPLRALLQQAPKSWYVAWFQVPELAERWLGRDPNATMSHMFAPSPRQLTPRELQQYAAALSVPGALPSALAYYRDLVRYPFNPPTSAAAAATAAVDANEADGVLIRVPTLLLWGMRDVALHSALGEASASVCESVKLVQLARATHFVVHDEPDAVNTELYALARAVIDNAQTDTQTGATVQWPPAPPTDASQLTPTELRTARHAAAHEAPAHEGTCGQQ